MNWKSFLKPTKDKIIILFVLFVLFAIIVRLVFGTTSFYYFVVGDSMSPAFNPYDIVFVKKLNFNRLKSGDAVLFSTTKNRVAIIGRIVSIDFNNKTFTAKQDNIEKPLSYEINIPLDLIKGKVIGKISSLGYIEMYRIGLLIRSAILYLLSCFVNFGIRKIRKK